MKNEDTPNSKENFRKLPAKSLIVWIIFSLLFLFIFIRSGFNFSDNLIGIVQLTIPFTILLLILEIAAKKYDFIMNFVNIILFWFIVSSFIIVYDNSLNAPKNSELPYWSFEKAEKKQYREEINLKQVNELDLNIKSEIGNFELTTKDNLSEIEGTYFYPDEIPETYLETENLKATITYLNENKQFNFFRAFSEQTPSSFLFKLNPKEELINLNLKCEGPICNTYLDKGNFENIISTFENTECDIEFSSEIQNTVSLESTFIDSKCSAQNLHIFPSSDIAINNSNVDISLDTPISNATNELSLNTTNSEIVLNIDPNIGYFIEYTDVNNLTIEDAKIEQIEGNYSSQNFDTSDSKIIIKLLSSKNSSIVVN